MSKLFWAIPPGQWVSGLGPTEPRCVHHRPLKTKKRAQHFFNKPFPMEGKEGHCIRSSGKYQRKTCANNLQSLCWVLQTSVHRD